MLLAGQGTSAEPACWARALDGTCCSVMGPAVPLTLGAVSGAEDVVPPPFAAPRAAEEPADEDDPVPRSMRETPITPATSATAAAAGSASEGSQRRGWRRGSARTCRMT